MLSFFVAVATVACMLGLLVAIGKTNFFENLVLIALVTLLLTFVSAMALTIAPPTALIASSLLTLLVVGVGVGLLHALFYSVCGSSSDC